MTTTTDKTCWTLVERRAYGWTFAEPDNDADEKIGYMGYPQKPWKSYATHAEAKEALSMYPNRDVLRIALAKRFAGELHILNVE